MSLILPGHGRPHEGYAKDAVTIQIGKEACTDRCWHMRCLHKSRAGRIYKQSGSATRGQARPYIQPHSGDGKEKYSNLSTPDRTSRRGRMSRAVLECRLRCRTLLLGRSGHPQRLTAYSTHLYMCAFDQARHSFDVKLSEVLALQLVLQLPNYTTGSLTKLSNSTENYPTKRTCNCLT